MLFRASVLAGCVLLLSGCNNDANTLNGQYYDFSQSSQQWQAGFADYDSDNAEIYELDSGLRDLPAGFIGKGFYLAGMNRSDDLFMFISRQITGLEPSSRYQLSVAVQLLTNAGAGCVGIGGAPGEAVYLKFGYAEQQPAQNGYYLNVDKGQQSQDGSHGRVIGDIAANGLSCDGLGFASKTVVSAGRTPLQFTSNSDGSIWVFIGTDSGFEGLTRLYYQQVELYLTKL